MRSVYSYECTLYTLCLSVLYGCGVLGPGLFPFFSSSMTSAMPYTVGVKIKFPFRLRCTVNGPKTAT